MASLLWHAGGRAPGTTAYLFPQPLRAARRVRSPLVPTPCMPCRSSPALDAARQAEQAGWPSVGAASPTPAGKN